LIVVMTKPPSLSSPATGGSEPEVDIGLILHEIEKEPVPKRLLELAEKLQQALMERRRLLDDQKPSPKKS
jgi:hypothetical protein